MDYDIKFMRRALQLAARSPYDTHPNPMVGAVIVNNGRVIGEGFHRRCGEGHAEVNAVASVADKSLLADSTIYVTLEPCSHYGKTPPCARLIIDSGLRRVVVGAVDPFEKVAGRGIAMLRAAGVEVVEGVLADECRSLNRLFFTAHTRRRPFVTLKWAESADCFMDITRGEGEEAARFSTYLTQVDVHRLRASHDAILTTASTVMADNPSLNCRLWDGPSPRRVVIDREGILTKDFKVFAPASKPTLLYRPAANGEDFGAAVETVDWNDKKSLGELMDDLYRRGVTSILVEAGPRFLQAMLDAGLADAVRVERAPFSLGAAGAHPSPVIKAVR